MSSQNASKNKRSHIQGLSEVPNKISPNSVKTLPESGLKANGVHLTGKTGKNHHSTTHLMNKHLTLNNNNNKQSSSPQLDVNGYFSYLTECLKSGQMPNLLGHFNGLVPLPTSLLTGGSPVLNDSQGSSPRNAAPKRTQPQEPRFDDNGVLDLSMKKPRLSYSGTESYKRLSTQSVTVDEYGALDLSKK